MGLDRNAASKQRLRRNAQRQLSAFDGVRGEVPTGAIDSSNTVFTLAHSPKIGSVSVFQNGLRTIAFTIVGSTITMTVAPTTGDTLFVDYE